MTDPQANPHSPDVVALQRRIIELEQQATAMQHAFAELQGQAGWERVALEHVPLGVATTTPEGQIVGSNPALCTMLDYSPHELHAYTLADITHDEDMAAERPLYDELLAGQRVSYEFEKRYLRKDGAALWVRVRVARAIENGLSPAVVHIAERVAAPLPTATKADGAVGDFRTIIESMDEGVFVIQGGKVAFANPAFADMLGYTVDEIVGHSFTDFVAPEDLPWVADRYTRRQAGEDVPSTYDFHLLGRDDRRVLVYMVVTLTTYQGQTASMGTVRNVTEERRIVQAYEQNQLFLQSIINHSPAIIFIRDRDGRFLSINNRYANTVFNLSPEDVVGKTAEDLYPPHTAAALRQNDRDVFEGGESITREELVPHHDGSLRIYLAIKFPLYDARGEMYAIGGISTDITEQKEIEAALRRERELFVAGPVVVFKWVAREGWPVEYVSPNVRDEFGYRAEDFMSGRISFLSVVHPDDLERVAEEVATYRQVGAETFEQEYRLLHQNGRVCWVYDFTRLVRNEQGDITHYHGYILDITEQKQTEQLMIENQHLLQNVLDNLPAAVYVKDVQHRMLLINRVAASMLSLSPEETIGKTNEEILPAQVAAESNADEQRVLTTGKPLEHETSFPQADGEHTLIVSKFPIYNTAGDIYAVGGISTDITERKRAEAEHAALQAQVIEAQRAALRELSTPLMPITDNILVMPLVGALDSARAQQVMEALLEGIATHQAELAIIDITGVQVVDTQVANALIQTARAVQLLGAHMVLTGISTAMAQTLIQLGADLSAVTTRGTLQSGFAYAMQQE
jgi:rsbT co-antagonist protein RsbR